MVSDIKKILVAIIDDDEILCKNISEFLSEKGCDCVVAHDGKAGFDLILEKKPDIILLDVRMPFDDGMGLIRKISKEGSKWLNNIVIMTNSQSSEYLAEALELGIKKYFVKSDMSLESIYKLIKAKSLEVEEK
jgi:two-component system, response regulator YesN